MRHCERIRLLRKERHMTQEELANKVGVKRSVISKYENGNVGISVDMLERIYEALGYGLLYEGQEGLHASISSSVTIQSYLLGQENPNLIKNYYKLNGKGKLKITEYIEDMVKIPEYTDNTDE